MPQAKKKSAKANKTKAKAAKTAKKQRGAPTPAKPAKLPVAVVSNAQAKFNKPLQKPMVQAKPALGRNRIAKPVATPAVVQVARSEPLAPSVVTPAASIPSPTIAIPTPQVEPANTTQATKHLAVALLSRIPALRRARASASAILRSNRAPAVVSTPPAAPTLATAPAVATPAAPTPAAPAPAAPAPTVATPAATPAVPAAVVPAIPVVTAAPLAESKEAEKKTEVGEAEKKKDGFFSRVSNIFKPNKKDAKKDAKKDDKPELKAEAKDEKKSPELVANVTASALPANVDVASLGDGFVTKGPLDASNIPDLALSAPIVDSSEFRDEVANLVALRQPNEKLIPQDKLKAIIQAVTLEVDSISAMLFAPLFNSILKQVESVKVVKGNRPAKMLLVLELFKAFAITAFKFSKQDMPEALRYLSATAIDSLLAVVIKKDGSIVSADKLQALLKHQQQKIQRRANYLQSLEAAKNAQLKAAK